LKNLSIVAAMVVAGTVFTGCTSTKSDTVESKAIAGYLKGKGDANGSTAVESPMIKKYLSDKKGSEAVLVEAKESDFRSFAVRAGDTAKEIFERMGDIDKKTYVIGSTDGFESKFAAAGLKNLSDVEAYLSAHDFKMTKKEIAGSPYVKIDLLKKINDTEKALMKTSITLSGMISPIDAIDTIAQTAGLSVDYKDKGASDIGNIHRRISFKGNGLDGIRQIVNKAGMGVEFKDDTVMVSYFQTEAMNIDIFMRDRSMASAISNIPQNAQNVGGAGGATNGLQTSSNQQATTASSGVAGASQDLSIAYSTKLFSELKTSIDSSLSPYGSYSFLPTTGQVIVRDKVENIRVVQKIVSDFNAKFKDTIAGRITFYKVSMDKTDKRGLDIKALIGNHFSLSSNNMVSTAFSSFGTGGNFNLGVSRGNDSALLQFLRQMGKTEIVNSIDFESQSNSLKTIKVANNYGYISSVSSDAIAGSTNGSTTGSITPSSVPDGTFASIIAKPIGNATVALDVYTTSNSLSRFNSVAAFGASVQTPDTAEQSVDGYHQVRAGVPYILLSYKYNETKGSSQGLPVEWEWLQKIGSNEDSGKDVFIIVALEAAVK
jgi:hypothetical protein